MKGISIRAFQKPKPILPLSMTVVCWDQDQRHHRGQKSHDKHAAVSAET